MIRHVLCRSIGRSPVWNTSRSRRFLCSSEGSASNAGSEQVNENGESWRHRLLQASLDHVPTHGWTMASVRAAARDLGLAETSAGMLENGAADLVIHFAEGCNERLVKDIEQWKKEEEDAGHRVGISRLIHEALRRRLEMVVPYRKIWPEAVAVCSSPSVAPQALQVLLHFLDDVWCLAGDQSTEFSWYTKRATLASVYCSTELFLLMDNSEGQSETWRFLEHRLQDVANFGRCQAEVQKTTGNVMQSVREVGNAMYRMAGF